MFPKPSFFWPVMGLLAALPYFSGLPHAFVYDDHGVIVENPFFDESHGLTQTLTLQTLFRHDVIDGQRPVVIASYWFDRFAWGLWPPGYRLTNIALHVSTVIFVGLLLLRLSGNRTVVAAATILFAWHPLLIEAVQAPSFREDILYTCAGLLFLLSATRKGATAAWMVGGGLAYGLALLSKESAIIFPPLLAVLWWLFPAVRPPRRTMTAWMSMSVLITVVLMSFIITGRPVQAWGESWNGLSLRGVETVWSSPWLFVRMIMTMIVPYPLSVDYRFIPVEHPLDTRFIFGVVCLMISLLLIWRWRKQEPVWSASLAWLVIAFVPVSNVLPLLNPVADRYAYGVLPGFALLIASGAMRMTLYGKPALIVITVILLALTMNRLREWKDDRTLWTAALSAEPKSARAHIWLGILEKENGRIDDAWNLFVTAEELNPYDVTPKVSRAIILGERGDLEGAERLLRDVLKQHPDHKEARLNLDLSLRLQGKQPDE